MPMSNYPGGFRDGVSVRNIPVNVAHSGKVFWVSNNGTNLPENVLVGNDTDGKGTFNQPFATIAQAISAAAAGRGDIILVKAGHAETITDNTLALSKANLSVIGLGSGEDRPIITFSTSTAAALYIVAGNCRVENLVFKCNIASQVGMIRTSVAANDTEIVNCDFREGSATGLAFINIGDEDNDSDRTKVIGCSFHAPTAGNYDHAIGILADMVGVRIIDCDIYGDFDDAGISVPAGGNAQVDLRILRCRIDQLQAGDHAIEINSTTNTGMIAECYLQSSAVATTVDTGGLSMFETYVHDKADQSYAIVTGTVVS